MAQSDAERYLLAFWGKTNSNAPPGEPSKKPLLHHLLDVAAAAIALQHAAPARLRREAQLLGGADPEVLARARAYLAGLHDLGKLARAFQAKSPEHFPSDVFGAYEARFNDRNVNHWALTARLLDTANHEPINRLFSPAPVCGDLAIAAAIAGHHGRPPSSDQLQELSISERDLRVGREALAFVAPLAEAIWRQCGEPILALTGASDAEDAWVKRFTWGLAGLTTVADWVGSDASFFRFEPVDLPAEAYWPLAQAAAARAVDAKGLRAAAPAEATGISAVFPDIAALPRPLQRACETVAPPDGPTLAVLEDSTGAGKTEAAIVLAHRFLRAGKGEGLYFALPTMATANAMFLRLVDAHQRLFTPGEKPSVALAHGRRDLSEAFKQVRAAGRAERAASEETEASAAAQCEAWLADDRRLAFFADTGAGTIDQALLSVLPKKFLALRQYGLASKILIVDEAHSYGAYENAEIERLLRFHAAAGGSAIVLSATLTHARRTALLDAFRQGLGAQPATAVSTAEADYPMLSLASAEEVSHLRIDPAPNTKRVVEIERIGALDDALKIAREAAARGAAVAILRNAVDDAIAVADALKADGEDVTLFHARFAMGDRLAIEERLVQDFGKSGENRKGRIVVATQVIEQSLDLDFDCMLTDLAPVDMLIQRAGRLHRHARENRPIDRPVLSVLCPSWETPPDDAWLAPTQPNGRFVYRPGAMWRSAKALFEARAIRAPEALRALVEAAYDETVALPAALEHADDQWSAENNFAAKAVANLNLIDWWEGYHGVRQVVADQEIGTRLGRKTVTLRLARRDGDRAALAPWCANDDPRRAWALSEVTAPETWCRDLAPPPALEPQIAAVRADWPEFERDMLIGLVEDEGAVALHRAGEIALRYDPARGLTCGSLPKRG